MSVARLEKRRATDRKQRLVEQHLGMQRVGYFVGESYPDIEIPPVGVDRTVVGLELNGDIWVGSLEVRETRHQAPLSHHLDRDEFQKPPRGTVAPTFDHVAEFREDALDILQTRLASRVEAHAAGVARS